MTDAETRLLGSRLSKEFRPLLLPAAIAVLGSIIPPADDVSALLGSLAFFGGFALLAAMTFGLEFQQGTLGLLLSQPKHRSQIWGDKLLAIFLAALVLILLNWRLHQLLSDLQAASLLIVWMFFITTVSASGFWIRTTGSVAGGISCSLLNQFLVFGALIVALRREAPFVASANEILLPVFLGTTLYALTFLWLGRSFWKGAVFKIGAIVLLVLLLMGVSQIVGQGIPSWAWETRAAELCLTVLFLMGLTCSAGYWTLLARTSIGGATLSAATQFLTGLLVVVALGRIYGVDPNLEQWRFLGPLMLLAPLYCIVFLWLGWRKFVRLELSETAAENIVSSAGFFYRGDWSARWLRCQIRQSLTNLIRKELRLQKPLITLAGLFFICWLAAFCLQWRHPQYRILSDIVICIYAPVAFLLAGCVSLGDEKALGLTAWHLTLPISSQSQWFVKLFVAAATAAVLGWWLPLCLHLISAAANGAGWVLQSHFEAYQSLAFVSGSLFILSFWAATLFSNTVRAALSAVVALIGLCLCGVAGSWCAEHLESFRIVAYPIMNWFVIPLSQAVGVLNPGSTTFFLGLAIGTGVALLQSYRQFRRAQLPSGTVFKAPLLLAFIFLLLGLILSSSDYLARQ